MVREDDIKVENMKVESMKEADMKVVDLTEIEETKKRVDSEGEEEMMNHLLRRKKR